MSDISRRLEQLLFPELRKRWPSVYGHVEVVFELRWLVVYVYAPEKTIKNGDFEKVVAATDDILKTTEFVGSICRTDHSVGKDTDGGDHYSCWLPIAPQQTKENFDTFFPKRP